MYEITNFIHSRDAARSLGLHVQTRTREDSGDLIVWFVGTVPTDLAFAPGYTEQELYNGRNFGERFGPRKRFWSSIEDAWRAAEALGYDRCDCDGCQASAQRA